MTEPDEYIDFMAKYKNWISIKRLGIRSDTKPEEIVHYLAGVRSAIDLKSYAFLDIKTQVLDEYAKSICAGTRKSYPSLANALVKLDSLDAKRALSESCSKELVPLAEAYLISKVVTALGYNTSISQETMSKVYPWLKTPKGLGRKPKG